MVLNRGQVQRYWKLDGTLNQNKLASIAESVFCCDVQKSPFVKQFDGGVSQRKLTRTHRIGSATVERWYQSFVKQRVSELSGRSCSQVLGIDEHFFSRKRGYATTLVDLKHHKVFDVVLGRSETSLRSYLKRLPGKEQVRVIVMDISETYRRIARQYFPNAMIVADRFHAVRLLNQRLLALCKQVDAQGRKYRGLISLMRRHHWKLTAVQKETLHQYLAQWPVCRRCCTSPSSNSTISWS